jgi:hypothetical protein
MVFMKFIKAFEEFASIITVFLMLIGGALLTKFSIIPLAYARGEEVASLGNKNPESSAVIEMATNNYSSLLGVADSMATVMLFLCLFLLTPALKSYKRGLAEFSEQQS